MVGTLITVYLVGWLLVSVAAFLGGRWWADRQTPPEHPGIVSVAAGAVWPLLVVGLVELSSIMVLTKQPSKTAGGVGIFA